MPEYECEHDWLWLGLYLKQDETFPELGVGSVEGCEDQESVCSSTEREGDAFPKAFERDLVTPNNLPKVQAADIGDALTPETVQKSESDTKDKATNNECKFAAF